MSTVIKIAVQKSGRLYQDSRALIRDCGIHVKDGSEKLKTAATNFPLELFYVRDDDIPAYVEDGVADIGIVGRNVLEENGAAVECVEALGFARCRLSIAVPNSMKYLGAETLNGLKIATSYPNLLKRFLQERKVDSAIHEVSGSVEIAPGIGLADAVCDLVSSGSTLIQNGLREVEVVMESEALLIAKHGLSDAVRDLLDQLVFRIRSVQCAHDHKYIILNAPDEAVDNIRSLLPGMRSPTVTKLADEGWSSIHSVVQENDFWEVIEKLRGAGAEGILVMPIEKMIR